MMEKIKVMLVDDEILALEYLKNMICWEDYGFKVVTEATNGKKALALFEKYKPQIIFVDIRMPLMDGLELSRKIAERDMSVKIVLLTAYKDFDYARQAIEIGVNSYILKHDISKDTIIHELKKAKKELEQEEINNRIIRQKLFLSLIQGTSIEKISDSGNAIFRGENFILLLFQVDCPYYFDEEIMCPVSITPVDPADIKNVDLPCFVNYIEVIQIDNKRFIAVVSIKKAYSLLETMYGMNELLDKIKAKLHAKYKNTLSVAVSDIISNFQNMHSFYERLLKALELSVFYGKNRILYTSSVAYKNPDEETMNDCLTKIALSLNKLQTEDMDVLFDNLFKSAEFSPMALKKICKTLYATLDEFNRKYSFESMEAKFKMGAVEYSFWYDMRGIRQWFLEEFKLSVDRAEKMKRKIFSKKTQQALNYINLNYNKDLTIEQVAYEMNISSYI